MKEPEKLTVDEHYMRPQTAWEMMKDARNTGQTVYIYGVSGSGKTALAADFLARRRYCYFSVSDSGAEEIAKAVQKRAAADREKGNAEYEEKSTTILVLDDLYLLETPEERSDFEQLIDEMSGRKDIWLILISRSPLPGWLKALYIKHIFVVIGEEKLLLTMKEQESYFEKWGLMPTEAVCDRLWALGEGNPMFLRIFAVRLKEAAIAEGVKDRQSAELSVVEDARRDIWDYFESNVYDQWSVELQEFLEAVSIVERFDLSMAQQITKRTDAGMLIRKAQETGNFLIEYMENGNSVYELRTPAKESFRRRLLRKCSQTYVNELYCSAGNGYEIAGNVSEALKMYESCHNEEGISRILIENVRKNPAVGDYFELRYYYMLLPEEKIRESVELMAGMSMLQSMLLDEEESERWYRELADCAKEKTGGMKRAAENRLLYLDIALPHRETIHMVDLIKHAGGFLKDRKAILPEFSVTSNMPSMMNGGKDFCEWSRKDKELARNIGKLLALVLGKYGKGLVELALAESSFEKGGDNYEVASLAGIGRMKAGSGGKTEQVFVAVGILTQLSIINNHMADAQDMLLSFRQTAEKEAKKLLPNIDALQIRMELYTGVNSGVFRWLEQAPDEDKEFNCMERYRYLAKVRVYLAAGRNEKAMLLLEKLRFYAEKIHRTYISIEVLVLSAIALKRMGKENWRQTLQEAIAKAEDYHFVRILTREGAALWALLRDADIEWKDPAFKKQVMDECRQVAEYYPAYLAQNQSEVVILSDKAIKILRLQAEGMSVEKIALQLNLSIAGVKYYNQETYKKLGVNNKAAAVAEARRRRLM